MLQVEIEYTETFLNCTDLIIDHFPRKTDENNA